MGYSAAEGRREILESVATATDQLAVALAVLGEVYEQLDEGSADKLEEVLFRPVQGAVGKARRTHQEFARRFRMPQRNFHAQSPGLPAHDPRAAIDRAADAIAEADHTLGELQDTLLPVEVGDQELRTGLSDVRTMIAPLPHRARELIRILGR
jgi:hypothetical protein